MDKIFIFGSTLTHSWCHQQSSCTCVCVSSCKKKLCSHFIEECDTVSIPSQQWCQTVQRSLTRRRSSATALTSTRPGSIKTGCTPSRSTRRRPKRCKVAMSHGQLSSLMWKHLRFSTSAPLFLRRTSRVCAASQSETCLWGSRWVWITAASCCWGIDIES